MKAHGVWTVLLVALFLALAWFADWSARDPGPSAYPPREGTGMGWGHLQPKSAGGAANPALHA